MDVILTQAYVANKVAKRHPEFAHAKNTMSKTEYLFWVMNKKANLFSPDVTTNLKRNSKKR